MDSEILLACASLAAVGIAVAARATRGPIRPAAGSALPVHPATGAETAAQIVPEG